MWSQWLSWDQAASAQARQAHGKQSISLMSLSAALDPQRSLGLEPLLLFQNRKK